MKKCQSSIWYWDSNQRLLEYESPPITTRPGFFKLNCQIELFFQEPVPTYSSSFFPSGYLFLYVKSHAFLIEPFESWNFFKVNFLSDPFYTQPNTPSFSSLPSLAIEFFRGRRCWVQSLNKFGCQHERTVYNIFVLHKHNSLPLLHPPENTHFVRGSISVWLISCFTVLDATNQTSKSIDNFNITKRLNPIK